MTKNLILAVPSKGRLKEQFDQFMAKADMPIRGSGAGRGYSGQVRGISGLEVRFLSASEIAQNILSGEVHLGVTGLDLIEEINSARPEAPEYVKVAPLGFGHAKVIVAVPGSWVDVVSMADLRDVVGLAYDKRGQQMRVATKYVNLTRNFFSAHSVGAYRLVESLGATEGAPQAGSADLIVDITSSGSTLRANDLRILTDGEILASEASLFASLRKPFSAAQRVILRLFLDRLEARIEGESVKEVKACLPEDFENLAEITERFKARMPWAPLRLDDDSRLITLHCKAGVVADLVRFLQDQGTSSISVGALSDLYLIHNKLYPQLAGMLKG